MLTNFMYPDDVRQRRQCNTNNASHECYLSLRQISSKNYKTLYTMYMPTINRTHITVYAYCIGFEVTFEKNYKTLYIVELYIPTTDRTQSTNTRLLYWVRGYARKLSKNLQNPRKKYRNINYN